MSSFDSTTLSNRISVRAQHYRSVNIEQDGAHSTLLHGYILTVQARRALARMVESFSGLTPTRAWTLTGPYGSGKSYFALFLMQLLGGAPSDRHEALTRLTEIDPHLYSLLIRTITSPHQEGFLRVPAVGYRATLLECLRQAFCHALEPLRHDDNIVRLLAEPAFQKPDSSRAFVQWISRAVARVTMYPHNFNGILLVVDELGKALEHTSAHTSGDIYLLQELAEFANRSNEHPFLFVNLLHQSFERYATHLDMTTQREWAKVQGRFEDIAFQEPPAQQMTLLSKALEWQTTGDLRAEVATIVEPLFQHDALESWRPPLMSVADFEDLSKEAYPCHPTALVALPYIFRRLAQNERSLFAYLTSLEPFGFQDFLEQNVFPAMVRLPNLFDYVVTNFQGRLYTSSKERLLTETFERLNSDFDLSPTAISVLKTIGMLNWLADIGPFQATRENLLVALRSHEGNEHEINQGISDLQSRSLIAFRRFNRTYTVWQGSDVDIEARLQEAESHGSVKFSVADALQTYLPPRPIVARRHSYQTGTPRYFEVHYVDSTTYQQAPLVPMNGASGILLLALSATLTDSAELQGWAQESLMQSHGALVIGVTEQTVRLAELLLELQHLEWVRQNTPELRDDAVARRELRTRSNIIESLIRNDLDRSLLFEQAGNGCHWFHKGENVTSQAKRGLSYLLSNVCDTLYDKTPRLWNELINRRQISSQAAAARRTLIEHILKYPEKPTLGIEGFPPERSMYESLLKAGGLHREREPGVWELSAPPTDDPLLLLPLWQSIEQYIFALPPEPRSVQSLFERIAAPPFGITEGIFPILLCVFIHYYHDETTLYREGSLLPEPTIADWEVLIRRPELFSVAGSRVAGPRTAVIERLAEGLKTVPAALPVVRALIRMLRSLPEFAWRTQTLEPRTLAVRHAIDNARSPERLLFHDLPTAVELEPFTDEEIIDAGTIGLFFERLNSALLELSNATALHIQHSRDTLLTAFNLPTGEHGWNQFATIAATMADTVLHPTFSPLLRRAADAQDIQSGVESVLAFIMSRPARQWTDRDIEQFEDKASAFGKLFLAQRNGHAPDVILSDSEQKLSNSVAEHLYDYITAEIDAPPTVIADALQRVVRQLRHTNL